MERKNERRIEIIGKMKNKYRKIFIKKFDRISYKRSLNAVLIEVYKSLEDLWIGQGIITTRLVSIFLAMVVVLKTRNAV